MKAAIRHWVYSGRWSTARAEAVCPVGLDYVRTHAARRTPAPPEPLWDSGFASGRGCDDNDVWEGDGRGDGPFLRGNGSGLELNLHGDGVGVPLEINRHDWMNACADLDYRVEYDPFSPDMSDGWGTEGFIDEGSNSILMDYRDNTLD